jgi:hypothetical protein
VVERVDIDANVEDTLLLLWLHGEGVYSP